jgi:hypothetical protein
MKSRTRITDIRMRIANRQTRITERRRARKTKRWTRLTRGGGQEQQRDGPE